jgi:hypothetical protein
MIKSIDGKVDIESIQRAFKASRDKTADWRKEAKKWYDYVAGDQYTEEEMDLADPERAFVVFNRTAVYVETVTGIEALQRDKAQIVSRGVGPQRNQVADIWDAALGYVIDDSAAEVHQSEAFRDMVICGMGWTESHMDFVRNPDGDLIAAARVDPLHMYWDPMSTERNASDRRWSIRIAPYERSEIEMMWPDKVDEISWSNFFAPVPNPDTDVERGPKFSYTEEEDWNPDPSDVIWISHVNWYEVEPFMRVSIEGNNVDVPRSEWDSFKETFPELAEYGKKAKKRVYKYAFVVGNTVLEEGESFVQEGFSFQVMTGHYHRSEGTWFGIVKPFIDPQDWVNKMYGSIIETMATNSKGGGLLYEEDAVDDIRDLEESWARPAGLHAFRPGAISGRKIMPKPEATYPEGLDRLMTFAFQMFGEVSGVTPELMGMVSHDQPGVVEYQRKQASISTLAWAFDSKRSYLKHWGRIVAEAIQKHLADGRIIRASGGEEGMQYLPLLRDELSLEYEVVVNTAPSAPNERERAFAIMSSMMPVLIQAGIMPPPDVLDYMPLPAKLIDSWKKAISTPNPQQQESAQIAMEERKANIEKMRADALAAQAKAKKDEAGTELEIAKIQRDSQENAVRAQLAVEESNRAHLLALRDREIQALKVQMEQEKAAAQMRNDLASVEQKRIEGQAKVLSTLADIEAKRQKSEADKEAAEQKERLASSELANKQIELAIKALELQQKLLESNANIGKSLEIVIGKVDGMEERQDSMENDMRSMSGERDRMYGMMDTMARSVEEQNAEIERMYTDKMSKAEEKPRPAIIERDENGFITKIGDKTVLRDEVGQVIGLTSED